MPPNGNEFAIPNFADELAVAILFETAASKHPARSFLSIKVALPSAGKGAGSRFSAMD
jgi:hypothetical protein